MPLLARQPLVAPRHGRALINIQGRPTSGYRPPQPETPQFAAQLLTKGLAALIVFGVLSMVVFLVFSDEERDRSTDPVAIAGGPVSRVVDSAPLTLDEVFPDPNEVRASPGGPVYKVAMTHIDRECDTATTGTLGALITAGGCSQVVRAELTAPYGDYQVTAGIFNLADADGAAAVDDQVRGAVETGDGSFAAMGTDASATAAQVGWHSDGHYLLYCVITRPGGNVVPGSDPNAARITADLVDGYLTATVEARNA